jgi:hypothetical protein
MYGITSSGKIMSESVFISLLLAGYLSRDQGSGPDQKPHRRIKSRIFQPAIAVTGYARHFRFGLRKWPFAKNFRPSRAH